MEILKQARPYLDIADARMSGESDALTMAVCGRGEGRGEGNKSSISTWESTASSSSFDRKKRRANPARFISR